jgi:hypothetical protein
MMNIYEQSNVESGTDGDEGKRKPRPTRKASVGISSTCTPPPRKDEARRTLRPSRTASIGINISPSTPQHKAEAKEHQENTESDDVQLASIPVSDFDSKDEEALMEEPKRATSNRKERIWRAIAIILFVAIVVAAIVVPLVGRGSDCTCDQPVVPLSSFGNSNEPAPELTEQVMRRVYDTVFMTKKLYDEDPTQAVPGAKVYVDEPDAALWVKKDGTCFAIFRATTMQIIDWLENVPLGPPIEFQSPSGKTCVAIDAYYYAYYQTNFVDQFRSDIQGCVKSCGSKQCDLVIGGHSQGGGIAAIAAIDMEALNPIVIASNQPPAIVDGGKGPCEAIDPKRYYRFINTILDAEGHLYYDPVSSLAFSDTTDWFDWLGDLFVLGEPDEGMVHYSNYIRPIILPTLWGPKAHLMDNILPKLESYMSNNVFPIPTDGWSDGSICNFNEECQSALCYQNKCVATGSSGTPCNDASDCISGRCELFMEVGICRPKLEGGESCIKDSDCLSEKCSMSVCQDNGVMSTSPSNI